MRTLILSLAVTATLIGCSAQPKYDRYHQVIITPMANVLRNESLINTTQWSDRHRSGAALNQEGYRFVLAKNRNSNILDEQSKEVLIPINPIETALDHVNDDEPIRSYSIYETQRWERFCGFGKKMDIRDWDFIAQQGREFVPEHLKSSCKPKAYTRIDYIAAWQASCDVGELSTSDKIIRAETIRPVDVCSLDF